MFQPTVGPPSEPILSKKLPKYFRPVAKPSEDEESDMDSIENITSEIRSVLNKIEILKEALDSGTELPEYKPTVRKPLSETEISRNDIKQDGLSNFSLEKTIEAEVQNVSENDKQVSATETCVSLKQETTKSADLTSSTLQEAVPEKIFPKSDISEAETKILDEASKSEEDKQIGQYTDETDAKVAMPIKAENANEGLKAPSHNISDKITSKDKAENELSTETVTDLIKDVLQPDTCIDNKIDKTNANTEEQKTEVKPVQKAKEQPETKDTINKTLKKDIQEYESEQIVSERDATLIDNLRQDAALAVINEEGEEKTITEQQKELVGKSSLQDDIYSETAEVKSSGDSEMERSKKKVTKNDGPKNQENAMFVPEEGSKPDIDTQSKPEVNTKVNDGPGQMTSQSPFNETKPDSMKKRGDTKEKSDLNQTVCEVQNETAAEIVKPVVVEKDLLKPDAKAQENVENNQVNKFKSETDTKVEQKEPVEKGNEKDMTDSSKLETILDETKANAANITDLELVKSNNVAVLAEEVKGAEGDLNQTTCVVKGEIAEEMVKPVVVEKDMPFPDMKTPEKVDNAACDSKAQRDTKLETTSFDTNNKKDMTDTFNSETVPEEAKITDAKGTDPEFEKIINVKELAAEVIGAETDLIHTTFEGKIEPPEEMIKPVVVEKDMSVPDMKEQDNIKNSSGNNSKKSDKDTKLEKKVVDKVNVEQDLADNSEHKIVLEETTFNDVKVTEPKAEKIDSVKELGEDVIRTEVSQSQQSPPNVDEKETRYGGADETLKEQTCETDLLIAKPEEAGSSGVKESVTHTKDLDETKQNDVRTLESVSEEANMNEVAEENIQSKIAKNDTSLPNLDRKDILNGVDKESNEESKQISKSKIEEKISVKEMLEVRKETDESSVSGAIIAEHVTEEKDSITEIVEDIIEPKIAKREKTLPNLDLKESHTKRKEEVLKQKDDICKAPISEENDVKPNKILDKNISVIESKADEGNFEDDNLEVENRPENDLVALKENQASEYITKNQLSESVPPTNTDLNKDKNRITDSENVINTEVVTEVENKDNSLKASSVTAVETSPTHDIAEKSEASLESTEEMERRVSNVSEDSKKCSTVSEDDKRWSMSSISGDSEYLDALCCSTNKDLKCKHESTPDSVYTTPDRDIIKQNSIVDDDTPNSISEIIEKANIEDVKETVEKVESKDLPTSEDRMDMVEDVDHDKEKTPINVRVKCVQCYRNLIPFFLFFGMSPIAVLEVQVV